MFSFMIHWSWVSVFKLGGGDKPWKRFVPARVSNSNLRTFKDVPIHLMHTYHGIKQQPRLTVSWKTGNDFLWEWHCFRKAFAHCIPVSMKLPNQNSRSRSTFWQKKKNFKIAFVVCGNEWMFSFRVMWEYCLCISQLTGNFVCVCVCEYAWFH